MIPAEIVDLSKLVSVVASALVAGVGVCTLFALATLGLGRFNDHRAASSPIAVTAAYGLLAALTLLLCLAAIVYGVVLLGKK